MLVGKLHRLVLGGCCRPIATALFVKVFQGAYDCCYYKSNYHNSEYSRLATPLMLSNLQLQEVA